MEQPLTFRIKRGGWFIEDEETRGGDERLSETQPLLHPPREHPYRPPISRQPDSLEEGIDDVIAAGETTGQVENLIGPHPPRKGWYIWQVPDVLPSGNAARLIAEDRGPAAIARYESEKDTDESRLPGPVRADKSTRSTILQRYAETIECELLPIAFRQLGDDQRALSHRACR